MKITTKLVAGVFIANLLASASSQAGGFGDMLNSDGAKQVINSQAAQQYLNPNNSGANQQASQVLGRAANNQGMNMPGSGKYVVSQAEIDRAQKYKEYMDAEYEKRSADKSDTYDSDYTPKWPDSELAALITSAQRTFDTANMPENFVWPSSVTSATKTMLLLEEPGKRLNWCNRYLDNVVKAFKTTGQPLPKMVSGALKLKQNYINNGYPLKPNGEFKYHSGLMPARS